MRNLHKIAQWDIPDDVKLAATYLLKNNSKIRVGWSSTKQTLYWDYTNSAHLIGWGKCPRSNIRDRFYNVINVTSISDYTYYAHRMINIDEKFTQN